MFHEKHQSERKNRFKLLTVSLFKVVLNDECSSFKNKEKKCLFLFMIKMRKNKKKIKRK